MIDFFFNPAKDIGSGIPQAHFGCVKGASDNFPETRKLKSAKIVPGCPASLPTAGIFKRKFRHFK